MAEGETLAKRNGWLHVRSETPLTGVSEKPHLLLPAEGAFCRHCAPFS